MPFGIANRRNISAAVVLALSGLANSAIALSPWVEVGDIQARHHIEALYSQGCLDGLTLSWPQRWQTVHNAYIRAQQHTAHGQCDNVHARYLLKHSTAAFGSHAGAAISLGGANQEPVVRNFSGGVREEGQAQLRLYAYNDRYALRLAPTIADADRDDQQWRADDSFVSAQLGNWQLGVGAIDRWWSPAWESGLIMSNNARPVPGLWLSRAEPLAFTHPWFSWLGPWDLHLIAGQKEQHRHIPDAKLLGARLVFQPLAGFQLGFTRTLQWGGEGRPTSLSSLGNALIGRSNGASDGFDRDEEPANQLAGLDMRYAFMWGQFPMGVYGEFIGEDEANYMPSQYAATVGLDMVSYSGNGSQRWIAEYTDTVAGLWGSEQRRNSMYKHHIYRSGYRYKGRTIGSTWESDARIMTLGVHHFFDDGAAISLALSGGTLELGTAKMDNVTTVIRPGLKQELYQARVALSHAILGGQAQWSLAVNKDPLITVDGPQERATVGLSWTRTLFGK